MSETKGGGQSRAGFVGLFALVGSALVGFNSLVSGCSNDRAVRNAAQLHRIEQREQFWTEAMRDFDEVVKERSQAGTAGHENWKDRCSLLALRTAPFVENAGAGRFAADGIETMSAELFDYNARVDRLQQAFVDQIKKTALVGQACSVTFDNTRLVAISREDEKERGKAPAAQPGKSSEAPIRYQAPPPVAAAIVARQDVIALTPASENGWDIDLFWCERSVGADSESNFKEALVLARQLADQQQQGNPLRTNRLGRIRVRMLASTLSDDAQYRQYSGHRYAVRDHDNEKSLVDGLIQFDSALEPMVRDTSNIAARTPWYVSLFYCAHGQAGAAVSVSARAAVALAL